MSNGNVSDETVMKFANLFRGGKVALDDGKFRPWVTDTGKHVDADGKDFVSTIADHLKTGPSIGVYPLFVQDDGLKVYWGCVDWDTGRKESYVHACNVYETLRQLDVMAWIERSKSKGFHLWVFFKEAMLASDVRYGLIGACNIVDAPTKEVNPKQTELTNKGLGNGVRLPYGFLRETGGPNEMDRPEWSFSKVPVKSFVDEASENMISPEAWKPVRALYKPPERSVIPILGLGTRTGTLTGLAGSIRENGPRESVEKGYVDRSGALYSLACAMVRQGYTDRRIMDELISADKEWGAKYASRDDGAQRLHDTLNNARKHAYENEHGYNPETT
tara:strand:+ start:2924 stop:3919 length:996 start_codon:yes stop_codon:yes gene_type:complete